MMRIPVSFPQPAELFTYMVDSLQVWTARICETSLNMAENTRIYRRIMLKYSTELMFTYWNTLEFLAKCWQEPPGSRKA
jgi:hypothetical protein